MIVHQLVDVRISEGDQFLLYLRNLPSKVQEFLQLHQNATTVLQLKLGVQDYYIRTRVQGDLGSVHVAQPVQKAGDLKDRTCFNCGKKGHLAEFFFFWCIAELAIKPCRSSRSKLRGEFGIPRHLQNRKHKHNKATKKQQNKQKTKNRQVLECETRGEKRVKRPKRPNALICRTPGGSMRYP